MLLVHEADDFDDCEGYARYELYSIRMLMIMRLVLALNLHADESFTIIKTKLNNIEFNYYN